jgi:hypothetical protein
MLHTESESAWTEKSPLSGEIKGLQWVTESDLSERAMFSVRSPQITGKDKSIDADELNPDISH